MLAGGGTLIVLYAVGLFVPDPRIGQIGSIRPYYLLGLDPIVWGFVTSIVAGVVVSLVTTPPDARLVSLMFDRDETRRAPSATLATE
jgi:sodium/pantothenate symporter